MSIKNSSIQIKLSEGRCRRAQDGSWGRGTKALSGYGDYSLTTTSPQQLLSWAVTHVEAEAKTAVTWVSPASYCVLEQAAWEAVYPAQYASWKDAGFPQDAKPAKLARSKDRENITAQFWAFDVDGAPDPGEWAEYLQKMEQWVSAGRPAKQGPAMPKGRGIPAAKKNELIKEFTNRGWACAVASTFSSPTLAYPGHERLRWFFVGDETVTTNEDFDLVWRAFENIFQSHGVELDTAPRARSSIFYAPAYPPGCKDKAWGSWFDGDLVPVAEMMEAGKAAKCAQEIAVKSSVSQRDDAKTKRSPTYTGSLDGGWLPADTTVTLSDGREVHARDLDFRIKPTWPCWSPCREEDHPSAFVSCVPETGRVYIHDSGTKSTFRLRGFASSFLGCASTFSSSSYIEEKVEAPVWFGEQTPALEQLLPDGGVVFARAPLGRGKTTYAAAEAQKVERVCAVTDSVALAASVAEAYGCEYYAATKDPTVNRLGVTVHSLGHYAHRLPGEEHRWDLMVVDEISSIRSAIHSDTLHGISQWAKESLLLHILNSKRTFITSADFTNAEMDLFEKILKERNPGLPVVRVVIDPTPGQRRVHLFSKAQLNLRLVEAVRSHEKGGAPIVVFVPSTQGPKRAARLLAKERPDLSIGWISSENSSEFADDLKDPNKWLSQYDVLICSPSIKAGLSWSIPVAAVYGFFDTPTLLPRDIGQMLMRVRNLPSKTLQVSVSSTRGEWDCDPAYLTACALGLASATEKTIDRTMIQYREDWRTGTRIASDPELLSTWVYTEAERRCALNNYLRGTLRMFSAHGWSIEDMRDELSETETKASMVLKEQTAVVKEELIVEKVEALTSADVLTAEEAALLQRKHGLSRDEKNALERFQLETFYERHIDEELLAADKEGRTRRAIKSAVSVMHYQVHGVDLQAYRDYMGAFGKNGTRSRSRDVTELRHHALRVKLQDKILRMVFPEVDYIDLHNQTFSADTLAELGDWLGTETNRRLVREVLGQSCTAATAQKPTQWFSAFLRSLGAATTSKRPRKDGGARRYTVDLTTVLTYARPEAARSRETFEDLKDPTVNAVFALDIERLMTTLSQ